MVTMVLLKVEQIWATPLGMFFLLFRGPVLRVGLAMAVLLKQCHENTWKNQNWEKFLDDSQTLEKLAYHWSEPNR
jgi:hypothetical protein